MTVSGSRRKLWILLAIAIIIVGVVGAVVGIGFFMNQSSGPPPPPNGPNVTIWNGLGCSNSGNCGYSPTRKSVTVGTTLTWTNDGNPHTVTTCDSSHFNNAGCPAQNAPGLDAFDSGTLEKGSTFSHTFTTAGTFYYYCTLHPWMQGEIVVQQGGYYSPSLSATLAILSRA